VIVCVFVCAVVDVWVHLYKRMCMYAYTSTRVTSDVLHTLHLEYCHEICVSENLCACVYVCVYVVEWVCMCVCVCACLCVCVCVCMCVCDMCRIVCTSSIATKSADTRNSTQIHHPFALLCNRIARLLFCTQVCTCMCVCQV